MEGGKDENTKHVGLSTESALLELLTVIRRELENFYSQQKEQRWKWLRDAYHHESAYSTLSWVATLLIFIEVLIFMACFSLGCTERAFAFIVEGLILLGILILNVYLVGWDSKQRHLEIAVKTEKMCNSIKDLLHSCQSGCYWDDDSYPHLYMPQSPCISLQWTYRDGKIVNLPTHLLVEGDIIMMRPGHQAPGLCVCAGDEEEQNSLQCGEVFVPNHFQKENVTSVVFKKPTKSVMFIMQETPYASRLRFCLKRSLFKPVTTFNKERHTILCHYVERIIIPIVLVLALFVNGLHSLYLSPGSRHLFESFVLRPAITMLPLLPLASPVCWLFLNVLGMAYLLATADFCKSSAVDKQLDPFSEVEDETSSLPTLCVSWQHLKKYMKDLFCGQEGLLWRSANLLQILGSVTALCCVDKKGILSWPNPTPEKVFFVSSQHQDENSDDKAYFSTTSLVDGSPNIDNKSGNESLIEVKDISETSKMKEHIYHPGSRVEVLDLTHNISNGYSVQFDDPNWKKYITNLKPLGLSILVNSCNPSAQEHYSTFSDHITCESLHNYAAVPVMNKRCLCELARQMGFMEGAAQNYQLQQLLAAFRHVRPELIQKGPLAKSLNYPRLKTPFPNVSSAIIHDLHSGGSQLFSQGTADLLLDCCSEYWDGRGIAVLTESDRKRILDFYQRSSLTAHCMAFSYSALSQVPDKRLSSSYLELPPDCGHMFPSYRAFHQMKPWKEECEEEPHANLVNHCLSTDSLFLQRQHETDDLETFLQLLNSQIFIGMVTMQYQACLDFVQLIEVLEKACIRFVHFSKENELRSRVFSEKMGMESGWNCHISLLNEVYRSRSASSSKAVPQNVSNLLPKIPSKEYFCVFGKKKELTRCRSAPTLLNLENLVSPQERETIAYSELNSSANSSPTDTNKETDPLTGHETTSDDILDKVNHSYSSSHSHVTDHTVPVKFDMSNRAKLPKGIHNIRPHIENVDNVPLLVSLFTDCTPEATTEMIGIMQEYGEVVCCLGSAANVCNIPIFLKADISLAVEPMYPRLCLHQMANKPTPQTSATWTPTELSAHLNSLPCALTFQRDDPVSLYHLIMEARHFTGGMQNCLLFMLCCCISLSLLILLCNVFFLPLPLSVAHILWMVCLEVPLLSLSLMGNPVDAHVMAMATGKNLKVVNGEMVLFFLCCYCIKFCPSVIISTMSFSFSISHFCVKVQGPKGPCWMFLDGRNETTQSTADWPESLAVSQNLAAFIIIFYFVIISAGFVHRSNLLWKQNPFLNKCWTCSCILVLVLQLLFSLVDLAVFTSSSAILDDIPFYVWIISFSWPIVLLPLNSVIKMHEIKINVRQQKRARLEFGTKLGMNSPF